MQVQTCAHLPTTLPAVRPFAPAALIAFVHMPLRHQHGREQMATVSRGEAVWEQSRENVHENQDVKVVVSCEELGCSTRGLTRHSRPQSSLKTGSVTRNLESFFTAIMIAVLRC